MLTLSPSSEPFSQCSPIFQKLDEALPQPAAQLAAMIQQVGQVKIQLRFLLQLKLLKACRRLRQHLAQHGRLPLLNLNFRC